VTSVEAHFLRELHLVVVLMVSGNSRPTFLIILGDGRQLMLTDITTYFLRFRPGDVAEKWSDKLRDRWQHLRPFLEEAVAEARGT
jgi:hypothetical protein